MDKVKFSPLNEIIRKDLNGIGDYAEAAFRDLIHDFLTETSSLVAGLRVRAQAVPDMSVYVEAGRIYQDGLQGEQVDNLEQPLVIAAAHPQYDRIDRVCAQYSAIEDLPENRNRLIDVTTKQVTQAVVNTRIHGGITFMVVAGTAAQTPAPPAIPDGFIALARVTVHAAAVNIQNTDILDERPTIRSLLAHTHSGGTDGAQVSFNHLKDAPDVTAELNAHKAAAIMDHPDGSVTAVKIADNAATDAKIGNRTANQNETIASNLTGSVTKLFSYLYTRIRQIMGTTNFYDAIPISLADIVAKFGTSGHSHTGAAGDAPQLTSTGLADGAATDAKIGNRTVNQALVSPGNTGPMTSILSWLAGRIKAITGKTNWYDAPAMTLEYISTLFGVSGHSHDGTAGQGPKIAYSNITGTPASLPANGGASRDNVNTDVGVAREIRWQNYGAGHGIVDSSAGNYPNGNGDAQSPYGSEAINYPRIVGYNGEKTYGVRVDSARRADSAGNADTVGGYTAAQLITSANIAILTGTVAHGGTIPLPAGYTAAQCRWMVSIAQVSSPGGEGYERYVCSVDENRVVAIIGTKGGKWDEYGNAHYMVIGVKS